MIALKTSDDYSRRLSAEPLSSLLPSPYTVNTSLSTMSLTVVSSSNFQSIFNAALTEYSEHTGVDLSQYPFEKLRTCQSADDILKLFQEKAEDFKEYRNGNRKLINCLEPVVQVLHTFSGVLGDVAGLVCASSSDI